MLNQTASVPNTSVLISFIVDTEQILVLTEFWV